MAANPLFRSYRSPLVFNTKIVHSRSCLRAEVTAMAQPPPRKRGDSSTKSGNGGPHSKKRRLDNPLVDEGGDWDDSFEMTQQDLESLDVMASQAIEGGPSTSKEGASLHEDTEQTLELGAGTSFSAAGQDQPGVFQAPAPGSSLRLKNRSSTSSSSDSSVYPHSSASFSSIYSRKTSTSDVSSAPGSLTSKTSSSSHSSGETHTGAPGASTLNIETGNATVTALREDLRKKEEDAQKARGELYAKEGEVKFLKDSLHKQEAELERLRAEREEWKDAEEQRRKEHEKDLQQEVERLQTQVQFKAQDVLQLQQRCRTLESRLAQQQTSTSGAGPSPQLSGSPEKSPKVVKVVSKGNRTPEKRTFPSSHSFMSTSEVSSSPRTTAGGARNIGTMTMEVLASSSQPPVVERERRSCMKLTVPCPRGQTRGPQLVSQLLQYSCASGGEVEDSGIVGLLQMFPVRRDLTELKYERVDATARLSPVKKSRRTSSPGVRAAQPTQPPASKPVVEREHFRLALQGLRDLISEPQTHHSSHPTPEPTGTGPHQPSGALLLLPMLNDYLKHYIDILGCGQVTPTSPNISSSKSSSCETGSSLESLTSSLEVLLQQGAEYANSVETLTLCALRVLHMLVCACEEVRSLCVRSRAGVTPQLQPATDTSSSSIGTDHERDKTNESGMEGDDEQSTASSEASSFLESPGESVDSPVPRLQDLNLLVKLLRLASPSQESTGFKVSIVEAALDILISLAVKSPETDLHRLNLIILRGVLTDCLQLEHQPGIIVRALDLFSALARSRSVLPFLCTKSDSCTLLNIHLVSTRHLATCRGKEQLQSLLLHIISKAVDSVSSVVSFHRNGVHILTDNDCRCSGQIIPSLIHSMFYLLRDYQVSHSIRVFAVLRKGVVLLHEISLRDPNFQQRLSPLHPYSTLMSDLSRVYKNMENLPQEEVAALEDLWEELDESDAGSQDSDHGEPMATE